MKVYSPRPKPNVRDVFDGRFEAYGIREVSSGIQNSVRSLTDGSEFLILTINGAGVIETFAVEGDEADPKMPSIVETILLALDPIMFVREFTAPSGDP